MNIKNNITKLYYITHKNNIKSIIETGIYCRNAIKKSTIAHTDMADKNIIERRKKVPLPNGESLLNYVNLFLHPRNSVLSAFQKKFGKENIVILSIGNEIILKEYSHKRDFVMISDRLAAVKDACFYSKIDEGLSNLDYGCIYDTKHEKLCDDKEKKDKKRAEILIYNNIETYWLSSAYVSNQKLYDEILDYKQLINHPMSVKIDSDDYLFFQK